MKLGATYTSSDYTKLLKNAAQANLAKSDKSQGIARPQNVTSNITPSTIIRNSAAQTIEFNVARIGSSESAYESIVKQFNAPIDWSNGGIPDTPPGVIPLTRQNMIYPAAYGGITIASSPIGIYSIAGGGNTLGVDKFTSICGVHVGLFDQCIYFIDNILNKIFKIDSAGGINTVISSGLNDPRVVVQSYTGDLYIANQGGKNILKWDHTTSALSVIVGVGGIVDGIVNSANGLALDYDNNYLYTTDNWPNQPGTLTNAVWRIPLSNPSQFYRIMPFNPSSFAAYSSSSLYYNYTAYSNTATYKYENPASGTLRESRCIWGPAPIGYDGDNGLVNNAKVQQFGFDVTYDGRYMYIACGPTNVIRRVDLTTNIITTVVGNGTAGLVNGASLRNANMSSPYDVKVDLYGNLVIAELGNARVRYVKLT